MCDRKNPIILIHNILQGNKLCGTVPNKRGFTLVELLMTIVVVGIISIPLSLSLSQHIRSTSVSQENSTAINLGRLQMEEVNNIPGASILIGTTNINYTGYPYDITRTVTYVQQAPPESLKRITVEVRKSGSAAILVSFVTYIAANVLYGI